MWLWDEEDEDEDEDDEEGEDEDEDEDEDDEDDEEDEEDEDADDEEDEEDEDVDEDEDDEDEEEDCICSRPGRIDLSFSVNIHNQSNKSLSLSGTIVFGDNFLNIFIASALLNRKCAVPGWEPRHILLILLTSTWSIFIF